MAQHPFCGRFNVLPDQSLKAVKRLHTAGTIGFKDKFTAPAGGQPKQVENALNIGLVVATNGANDTRKTLRVLTENHRQPQVQPLWVR
jgi:hypothetical protein